LIRPRALELTAGEEIIAAENEDIIAANGYEIEVHHDAPPTQRIKLLAQPVSKSTVFGIKGMILLASRLIDSHGIDLEELIYLLSEHPGEMVRCSKARAMFASRACRKSVMIGHTLNKSKMIQVCLLNSRQ
jgi:DNA mismatch repair protein PMS2